ncbi:MAG: sigma 54-interacting transcriptional regulator [Syntrophales bacterium]|jgi:transcriptional regulator with PAS, ATPase and Fis domain
MMENSKPKWLSYLNNTLLDAFVDNPYECPIVIDENGIIRFMSRYNVGLYGLTPEQAVGKHITEVNKNSGMHETLITGKVEIGTTYQLGTRQQIVARIPLRDRDGKIIGVLGKRIFNKLDTIRDLYQKLEILEGQLKYYRKEATNQKIYAYDKLVAGKSALIQETMNAALQAAKSDATVLVTGESGTGKEACAIFIHKASKRADGSYIRVNCAAIPAELIESELFGYEGGAFTGAKPEGKPGKFELAHKGTILLDEIGDMPLNMQAKLLRVLQDREIERVGGTKPIKVDFRLIASTNKDLQEMIKKGTFRMDLFYRMNIFTINTPSLRSIPEDIPEIASFLMNELSQKENMPTKIITGAAMIALQRYPWPGNVRELRNVIERALIITEAHEIQLQHLPTRIKLLGQKSSNSPQKYIVPLRDAVAEAESKAINDAIRSVGGNKQEAAKILGVHRTILYQKLKKYNIPL